MKPETLRALLNSDKPEEATEAIEAVLNILFTMPAAIVSKQIEQQIKKVIPNNTVKIVIGTYQGKKAIQAIICEADTC